MNKGKLKDGQKRNKNEEFFSNTGVRYNNGQEEATAEAQLQYQKEPKSNKKFAPLRKNAIPYLSNTRTRQNTPNSHLRWNSASNCWVRRPNNDPKLNLNSLNTDSLTVYSIMVGQSAGRELFDGEKCDENISSPNKTASNNDQTKRENPRSQFTKSTSNLSKLNANSRTRNNKHFYRRWPTKAE